MMLKKCFLVSFGLFLFAFASACGMGVADPTDGVEEGDVRIAAVGDSITDENLSGTDYPAKLDEMLGEGYAVRNFGESNHAVQFMSDYPYTATDSYVESLAFNPDIVILMLGTNDTKSHNWNGAEVFKEDYVDLLESYLEVDSLSRVILASPPTVHLENVSRGSINPAHIEPIRQVVQDVAIEYDLEFVDMTTETAPHPEWFYDGIHPTRAGAEKLAEIFYEQIINEQAILE